jgi:spore germination protein YaaH
MIGLTLESVAPEKLLVGIPFYTRMWRETDGVVKNFKTLGIDDTLEFIEEKDAEMIWDEESGQYFATFTEDGSVYKMWIEEPESIGMKAGLVNEFGLAGAAVWQLSLGNEGAWDSIGKALSER